MEYTVKKLAVMAGVSTRTLRYYDEIDILKPSYINEAGYRVYTQKEVDLLQQILFYRALDMKLDEIKEIICSPDFNILAALETHYTKLISRREEINKLIAGVELTMAYYKGEIKMTNQEKFEAFKQERLKEEESKYGKEARHKYGKGPVEDAYRNYMNLSEEAYKRMEQTEQELFEALKQVIKTGDLKSESAKRAYEKHKAWLNYSWTTYSKEAHRGIAQMYVADERFCEYYDNRVGEKGAEILKKIILEYTR